MKIAGPVIIVFVVIAFLVSSAVDESAKKVLTVSGIISENKDLKRMRVGARVSSPDINIQSGEDKKVSFLVKDPISNIPGNSGQVEPEKNNEMKVVFKGLMPDTLKEGRDVIMEGDFLGDTFYASTLNTQCPSKYEPPKPK